MDTLFLKILNMTLTAAYVIVAVLLIRLLLKRAPKKYSYLLWAIVLFRLVCPVSISSELSLFNAPPFDMTAAQKSGQASLSYVPADIGYMENPGMTVGIPTMNVMISDTLPSADQAASANPLQIWIQIGTVLWFSGSLALLIYGMVSYFHLKRRMVTAIRLDNHIFESDIIRSPFILGFINPRIYIPFGLREQERVYILKHEAYHLKRKDHLIKPLAFVILAFHWFNPLVWLAFALMAKDMEMSCDEKVLSETGSGIAKEYCTSLLSFATNRRLPSASPLAFGETGIRERVKNILRFRAPKKRVIAFSAGACIIAVAVCATNPIVNGTLKETGEPYGSYRFEKQVYMNPLSSFMPFEGFKEYYTLTEDSLTITNEAGNQQKLKAAYERKALDEQEFKDSFMLPSINVPNISGYKERYEYVLTDSAVDPQYRLFLLDDELWLAKIHKDTVNTLKSEYMWSIYKISKLDDEISGIEAIAGTQDGVEAFLALQKDFNSGYDADKCYNITPESIKENSDYSIFKYDKSSASFLLYKGEVYPLGEWFGGLGLTSMALADMDNDGESELYFTYSWGSGLHRSHAAYYSPATKEIKTLAYTHLNADMTLVNNRDGSLTLFGAAISNMVDFAHFNTEGTDFISDIVYANGQILLNAVANE
ncbi:beta-lactamase regulating signal transducer with metallopeptidase domain [Paenibacillus castaneae]|uniref:M56 family metallopeptidase n=1 Tax=Paenibacillus castaneae TaxID=474957 RepID=UPI000C9AB058|nr:M56 family metallopeptidase [Paenibacillus castaneae]NIK77709.1 beta-lactamase regulating signal transducer with metallopeptidase domain [Paenibacillus castaneae]